MKQIGIFNTVLVVLIFITLLLFPIFKVINANFKDLSSIETFLTRASVYVNASSVLRSEVESLYPKQIQNNILLYGLANKAVEILVTPTLVEKASKPALKLSFAFAKSPTSIINKKIVVSTSPYKAQAVSLLSEIGLPKFLVVNAQLLIDSVPKQLTLVNLEKNPNSPLAMIIKARNIIEYNQTALVASSFFLFFLIVVLISYNLRHVKKLFLAAGVAFGTPGLLILILYFLSPWLVNSSLPSANNAVTTAQNKLITDIVAYFAAELRNIALWYVGIALAAIVVFKFVKFDKTQIKLDKALKKVHIPTVEVKVHHSK